MHIQIWVEQKHSENSEKKFFFDKTSFCAHSKVSLNL